MQTSYFADDVTARFVPADQTRVAQLQARDGTLSIHFRDRLDALRVAVAVLECAAALPAGDAGVEGPTASEAGLMLVPMLPNVTADLEDVAAEHAYHDERGLHLECPLCNPSERFDGTAGPVAAVVDHLMRDRQGA